MTIPSTFADLGIPNVPLTEYVLRHADRLADQPALIDGPSGRTITYGDLRGAIAALAGGLAARGIGKGGVVGIMAPNLPEYAVVFHGTAYAGGAVTTINPTYTAHEVTHQLNDSGATILITIGMFLETARAAVEGTKVTEIVTIDPVEGVTNLLDLFGEPLSQQVPVDPATAIAQLLAPGIDGLGERLVRVAFTMLDEPETREQIAAMVRDGVSTVKAATLLREFLESVIVDRIASVLGVPDARMRVTLAVSYIAGAAGARYVLRMEPLASASVDELVRLVAPAVQTALAGAGASG